MGVAGGIHSGTAWQAVEAGAGFVIVGGAITKATDPAQATREIRRAMDEQAVIPTTLFQRVGAAEIGKALSQVSAANLSDALHRGGVLPGIRPLAPGLKVMGRALTVRTYPGDWAKPVQAIDQAEPGEVIVVDAGGVGPAIWGELATHSAIQRRVAGVVIHGALRDAGDIAQLRFPAFSSLVMPNAGEPKGFGEIGVPIRIAQMTIETGDWVLGDDDGVVILPQKLAVEYANRAMDVLERENRIREEIKGGRTLAAVTELLRWEKKVSPNPEIQLTRFCCLKNSSRRRSETRPVAKAYRDSDFLANPAASLGEGDVAAQKTMGDPQAAARERMVQTQLVPRGIRDPKVLYAMRKVPRHLFVEEALQNQAYGDFPLPIGEQQTISQPYIVAFMTEALELTGVEKVLEIGTGCGYQAAILAELAPEVYSIERIHIPGLPGPAHFGVTPLFQRQYQGWRRHPGLARRSPL